MDLNTYSQPVFSFALTGVNHPMCMCYVTLARNFYYPYSYMQVKEYNRLNKKNHQVRIIGLITIS